MGEAQLLQASADEATESDFRMLVDGSVKHITINPWIYDISDMCFGPSLISLLPPFPSGDWKSAHVSRDPATGQPRFESVSNEAGPSIQTSWHRTTVDYLHLKLGRKLRSNVYEATCPMFNSVVIAKFARFSWEVPQLEDETAAYQWIEGHGIGPDFLGHIHEGDRVIGFLTTRIIDFHHATIDDAAACAETLCKLHSLGVKHGDINKHNFLVHGGKATLIDFDCAQKTSDHQELDEELNRLGEELRETSGKGGKIVDGVVMP